MTDTFGACSACRASKVKCHPSSQAGSPCSRCQRLNEVCEYLAHRKGAKRKRHSQAYISSPTASPASVLPLAPRPWTSDLQAEPLSSTSPASLQSPLRSGGLPPPTRRLTFIRPRREKASEDNELVSRGPTGARDNRWPPSSSSPFVVIHSMIGGRSDWMRTSSTSIFAVPSHDQHPELDPITQGLITVKDAVRLFKRHADSLSSWSFTFDPVTEDHATVRSQSTFLFTTVCAVAADFCPLSKQVARPLGELAVQLAWKTLSEGQKSLQIIQALQLLSNHLPYPSSSLADRSWFYTGVAMRMLQELGFHRPRVLADDEDEGLRRFERSKMRTNICLYIHDISLSTQLGRPRMFPRDDAIGRKAREWSSGPLATLEDARLAAVVELRQIWERCTDRSAHQTALDVAGWERHWGQTIGPYEKFLYQHVTLLLVLKAIPVSLMGQEDEQQAEVIYNAALQGVKSAVPGLSDGGSLRYASNLGVIMIVYPAVVLFKMMRVSDPDAVAEETLENLDLLRELADAMLLAAAFRNDPNNLMEKYGTFLVQAIEAVTQPAEPQRGAEADGEDQAATDFFRTIMDMISFDAVGDPNLAVEGGADFGST